MKKKKTKDISTQDLRHMAFKIGRPTHKYLLKKLQQELPKIKKSHDGLTTANFINLIFIVMTNIDANVLVWLRNSLLEAFSEKDVTIDILTKAYVDSLKYMMEQRIQSELTHTNIH